MNYNKKTMITKIKVTLDNGITRLLNLGVKDIEKVDKNRRLFIQLCDGDAITNVRSEGVFTEAHELCLNMSDKPVSFCVPDYKIFGWCYAD